MILKSHWLGAAMAALLLLLPTKPDYDDLTAALRATVAAHGELASLESAGKTLEGRDIWVLTLGNRSAGVPLEERPALLMVANLEGHHVVGSEIALGTIDWLLAEYGTNDAVTKALDSYTLHVFPRLNPDGAERRFGATNTSAYDDDNDGRTDEDGPEDLNGDGFISLMRVQEPGSPYMIDPDDARIMKKADPKKGEKGGWAVYWEGTDDDNDGFYNEDAAGGVDLNRNFQHEYPYYQRGAGLHMVSERESRALLDFVVSHRHIAMVLTLSESDNLIEPPNNKGELAAAKGIDLFAFADASLEDASKVGIFTTSTPRFFGGGGGGQASNAGGRSGRRPATTVNSDDLPYFTAISKTYKELTGIETPPALRKPAGAFFEYGYYQFGVPSFSTPGWGLDLPADSSGAKPDAKASFDRQLIDWMDAKGVDGFVEWTAFDHPSLGAVEIGGFKHFEAYNPPADVVAEQGPKHGAFVAHLMSLFPRVHIAETSVTDHGGGIFRITAEIENAGFLPTSTAHGVTSRSVAPTMVQLGIDPDDILSGSAKTNFFPALDGSGNRQEYEWVVRGRRGQTLELKVVAQKGGSDSASITLN
ncbi:MAG: M14 family metallopeptidase [Rhodothermales bacterium]